MSESILVATGLRRSYSDPGRGLLGRWRPPISGDTETRPALLDVSLELAAGEMLGVVGESGSGKSTLARCISLLERPDAGRVVFHGRDLTAMGGSELRAMRRRIQVVFQDPFSSLNPRLSVGSAIGEVLTVHRIVPRDRVAGRVSELLDQVGLPERAAVRYPAEFSGGQRQRICIARALAAEPDVLIADEAVSSLDVSIQAQIINLLLDLQDGFGLAMIFISHNLQVVRRLAARVAVMFGGRIVELLPPGMPLGSARHPYTQALLAAAPSVGPDVAPITATTDADLTSALPTVGCPFRERCPLAFGRCDAEDPELKADVGGGAVACHAVTQGPAGMS